MSFRSEALRELELICLSLLLSLLFCSELAAQDLVSKAKTEKEACPLSHHDCCRHAKNHRRLSQKISIH